MSTWYSASGQSRLQAVWSGAPVENEEILGFILDTARLQVTAYAPDADTLESALAAVLLDAGLSDRLTDVLALLGTTTTDPAFNLVYAQLLQAQRLWAAGTADENGDIGTEGYSFVPRPLDKTIKNIIRPQRGDIGGGF